MQIDHEIRTRIEGDKFSVDNVKIGEEKYTLVINNLGGVVFLKFMKCDLECYEIIITPDGIQHERLLLRPMHDHNDSETLTKSLEWKKLAWNEVAKNALKIPFGLRVSNY